LNGVVGLNSYIQFICEDQSKSNVDALAIHADRMISLMGIDHVGCGFDFFEFLGNPDDEDVFSGSDSGCIGMEDCSKIPALFEAFNRLGLTKEEQDKIAFLNFQRIVKECIGG